MRGEISNFVVLNEAKRGGHDIEARILLSPHEHVKIHVIHSPSGYQSDARGRSKCIHFFCAESFKGWKGGRGTREEFCNDGFKIWAAHKILTKQSK